MKFFALFVFIVAILSLASCSWVKIDDYKNNKPLFKPNEFFVGAMTANGVVKNRFGKVTRYFNATIEGSWQGNQGTLVEVFTFDDGEIQHRTWVMSLKPNLTLTATAQDVVGTAQGQYQGNAMHFSYDLKVKSGDSEWILAVEDWMWLTDSNTLLSESRLSKWGIDVGSVQLAIHRKAQ